MGCLQGWRGLAHGELGVLGGPGSLHGRGKPRSCQAALLGSVGLGGCCSHPRDRRWAELQNRDAQTDTRRQKNQVEPESGKDRETKIDSENEKSKIPPIDCLLCARNCASHCHLLLYWLLLTTLTTSLIVSPLTMRRLRERLLAFWEVLEVSRCLETGPWSPGSCKAES